MQRTSRLSFFLRALGVLAVLIICAAATASASAGLFARGPTAPSTCSERVGNGGFETGSAAPWVESSALGDSLIFPTELLPPSVTPHGGLYAAWMGGYGAALDTLSQTLTIPVTSTFATLTYWWYMESDKLPTTALDVLTVTVRSADGVTLQALQMITNLSVENRWAQARLSLAAYAGQTIQIHFLATTDGDPDNFTSFYLDDVSLSACDASYTYLPLVARNFVICAPPVVADPGFLASQPGMLQINVDDAWQQCALGGPGVAIAVIDSGADLDHPDLISNLISGYDYVDGDAVPEDGHGHGSHVAGIAGAAINGLGVVGVAPNTRLLPVRVLDDSGFGSLSGIVDGIRFAADNAQILNLSLGSVNDTATLRDAIHYAANTKGRLVIAAAGNCGDLNYGANGCAYPDQPVYPGAYAEVMAVAAVTLSDAQASFSNQGGYVDIAAPGVSIYSTGKNGGYATRSGTSQAAPHVAGLAALIWARFPLYTAAQVRSAIEMTAVDLGAPGRDDQFGVGRIDALAAIASGSAAAVSVEPVRIDLPPPPDDRQAEFVPGRVLVKFNPDAGAAGIDQLLSAFDGVTIESRIGELGIHLLRVPAGQEWRTIDRLRARPEAQYAEPDYVVRLVPGAVMRSVQLSPNEETQEANHEYEIIPTRHR